ncbi:MAG: tyrosine-type recombinase/integrase [Streptosporangiaceae bacterium]
MTGPALLPGWVQLDKAIPQITVPMRRYLEQVACVLRPGSVSNTDQALLSFAAFLAETSPATPLAHVTRRHVEAFKPWLAARPGQNKPRLTTATIAHRLGTLRMFFVRIEEWGWDEAPPRVPMFPVTCPARTTPCPRPSTTPPPRSCCAPPRPAGGCWCGSPSRCCCAPGCGSASSPACALMLSCSSAPGRGCMSRSASCTRTAACPCTRNWSPSSIPTGAAHVPAGHPLLLPRENGRPLDRHTVTRMINRAGAAAGLPHIHPHQLRHTLATQAINRGMSLEAIAALLGHRSLDMTLRYARIASRTAADEYFAVSGKVEALYGQPAQLPATRPAPR